jgi:peptide/nickel transport system permease protein
LTKKEYRSFESLMPISVKMSLVIIVILGFLALFGPMLQLPDPYGQNIANALQLPSSKNWLGTDQLGRDLLSRIVAGSRFSLLIGFGAVSVGLFLGVPFGMLAGFYGRWVDTVFARVIDILLSFPGIILALAVVAVTGPGIGNLIVAVGLRTLPVFARVSRAETLSLRQRDFVDAARALGCRPYEIMYWHILPNIAGPLMIVASLQTATAILIGATLSFLGVGISPEVPEWGAILNAGRPYMMRYPHLVIVPGCTLMIAMMALNIVGDYLRDRLDPRFTMAKF